MKFSTIAFTSATLSAVLGAVQNITLFAESSDSSVNGLALSSIHEGAGINYFLLGANPEVLSYDDEAKTIVSTLGTLPVSVNILGQFLSLSVAEAAPITLNGDKLVVNGTENFFAAKNVNDPYNYSKSSFAIVTDNTDGAIAVTIKVVTGSAPAPSASASSSATPAIPSANAAAANGFAGAAFVAGAAALLL